MDPWAVQPGLRGLAAGSRQRAHPQAACAFTRERQGDGAPSPASSVTTRRGSSATSASGRIRWGSLTGRELHRSPSPLSLPAQPRDAAALAPCLLPSALERVAPVPLAVLEGQNEARAAREDETPDPPAKHAAHVLRGESFATAPESGHPPVRLLVEHDAD